MENSKKCSLMVLSVAQIVMSVVFLALGIIDGLKIRDKRVSLLFTPCWIAALALAIGTMGLVLARSRRTSSNLINAIWSFSVACILFSADTARVYKDSGMSGIVQKNADKKPWTMYTMDYTKDEKIALAVFGVIVILSIIEIILTAAIAKTAAGSYQGPLSPAMYDLNYQHDQEGPLPMRPSTVVPGVNDTTA